ncbi:NAD(P)H-dependent oxidoreductase [Roseomonas sp. PWR1]|uniref:NAD(P)H-dependent oxidoreductase n=1 Tax=Roseomonas nitratireducens TaxID=2820810 RepID=A0ABS4ALT9_9PROT|nr:NAD(P)H-dependent oxidoreductase [Neoroseomonas nitratireducens]MBP0462333.1 NAD(P)H-dependent oxidoreductase [Neoroseomonas nitratireducens]
MRVLVLFAHPLADSFHAALHAAALEGLARAGHEIDDCDLYAEGFDPVLSAEERRDYHDPALNRRLVAPWVERVQKAEAIVCVFPTWCFGPPAILKGFFDRVFLPGVSFRLEEGVAKPALTNIRRIAGIVTYGRPWWTALLMGDPPRMAVTRYLRVLTGWKAKAEYLPLYDMNRAPQARREAFVAHVRDRMARFG